MTARDTDLAFKETFYDLHRDFSPPQGSQGLSLISLALAVGFPITNCAHRRVMISEVHSFKPLLSDQHLGAPINKSVIIDVTENSKPQVNCAELETQDRDRVIKTVSRASSC